MTGNPETENALLSTLEAFDQQLEPLRTRQSETYWQASIRGTEETFAEAEKAEIEYRKALANRELFEELKTRLTDPGVQDLRLRRWSQVLLHEMAPHMLPEETLADLVAREKALESKVNAFRPEIGGESVTANAINDILRNSEEMEKRREAWEASKEIGPQIAQDIHELVKLRNVAARSLGYPDFYRMNLELQEIDEARLFSSLGNFAAMSEDSFRRMKARLDRLMADRFKIDTIDLAPWHYADPFFQEVPPVFGADTDPIYQGRHTLEWVKEYFAGIGLPIDGILDKGDYYEHEGKDPHAFCIDIDRAGDVRTLMNLKDTTYWANTALHEFGHAVYDLNIDRSLPHTLRRPAHISTTEAVAMFFGRLARDLEWMMVMFGLTGPQVRSFSKTLLEEQRMQMAVLSRWILVMIHFERGLYRDPDQDQQARWWDLVERFQLVRRPVNRNDKADWACKIHIAVAPVYYHNYLLGEWQASMFTEAMIRDLNLDEPAVWHGDPRIGEWFKEKIFSHGAMWEMNELVRNTTGNTPRPDAFVRQYL